MLDLRAVLFSGASVPSTGEIPTVLRADLYAVAALAGAAIVVIANVLQLPSGPATLVGAALCFGLRIIAIKRRWHLPVAGV